jgi:DNA-binding ferritin-like protein
VSTLRHSLTDLLATLRAIHWHSWVTHWKAKGGDSYSDHLLFQRIYSGDGGGPKIDDQIDGLGERMIALFGNDSVDGIEVAKRATKIHQGVKGLGMVAGALELEKEALSRATRVADLVAKGPPALRVGLDNFVRELADARSTVIYLLKQRLKGGAMDSYGAFDSGASPYTSAIFPVVISAGAGGIAASALKRDPKDGVLVGAAVGVLWSMMQMKKQDEAAEVELEIVEVSDTAVPNNVVNIADYRGVTFEPALGAADISGEADSASRSVIVGAVALFAAFHLYERFSGQRLSLS